ncbi:multidrug transporter [Neobacillus cucumis]|uniref:Multidrug transporter n=1 Tax=Neobacillus cucumis TaxID=1740721 RepID=A0A2N5HFL7_9BACI|nr:multidrug transporter [Neobacillus cucumis]
MTHVFIIYCESKVFIEYTLLIGAEGAKTPAGVRGRGDPAGAFAPRRLPGTPAESEAPGAQINRPFA